MIFRLVMHYSHFKHNFDCAFVYKVEFIIIYIYSLRKVLFLEPLESYCIDNWPNETDRTVILQMMTECTLHSDTLMRVLVIGHASDLPLQQADALDIADKLVARAANVHTLGECYYIFYLLILLHLYLILALSMESV